MSNINYCWLNASYDQKHSTGEEYHPENVKDLLLEEHCAIKNGVEGVDKVRKRYSTLVSEFSGTDKTELVVGIVKIDKIVMLKKMYAKTKAVGKVAIDQNIQNGSFQLADYSIASDSSERIGIEEFSDNSSISDNDELNEMKDSPDALSVSSDSENSHMSVEEIIESTSTIHVYSNRNLNEVNVPSFYNEWMSSSKPESEIVKFFQSNYWLTEDLMNEIYGATPVAANL